MWNTIMRIISGSNKSDIKLEGKVILRQLDTDEGKEEAKEFIKKHSKTTWRSWE